MFTLSETCSFRMEEEIVMGAGGVGGLNVRAAVQPYLAVTYQRPII